MLAELVSDDFRVVVGSLPESDVQPPVRLPREKDHMGAASGVLVLRRCSSGDNSCLGGNSDPPTGDVAGPPTHTHTHAIHTHTCMHANNWSV